MISLAYLIVFCCGNSRDPYPYIAYNIEPCHEKTNVTAKLISAFVFATPLLPKSEISSL